MGSVGGYDVGYDEFSRTTKFAILPGYLDIAQSKQRILLTPASHHRAKIYLRPADVWRVGGYDIGYDECSCTTNFVTAPDRQDIARVFDTMVPPA